MAVGNATSGQGGAIQGVGNASGDTRTQEQLRQEFRQPAPDGFARRDVGTLWSMFQAGSNGGSSSSGGSSKSYDPNNPMSKYADRISGGYYHTSGGNKIKLTGKPEVDIAIIELGDPMVKMFDTGKIVDKTLEKQRKKRQEELAEKGENGWG